MRHLTPALLALALPVLLAACADPLRDVERLSEVDLPPETLAAAAVPPPEEQADAPGFLSRLMGGTLTAGPELQAEVIPALAEAPDGEPALTPELVSTMEAVTPPVDESLTDEAALGTDAIEGDTEMAAASAPEPAQPRRRGLFGLLNVASAAAPPVSDGPDFAQIAPGTTLIYGQIATVCGLSGSQLGSPIGQASGYTLYDTNPGSSEQRTHYIMGFRDGCARQFRAALALFGDVGTHELVRYAQGAGDLPYSETDAAYEEIKGQVCRVPAGQPCGSALDRLAARTTFVTAYANFESNPQWAEILLSEGQVVAMGFEG